MSDLKFFWGNSLLLANYTFITGCAFQGLRLNSASSPSEKKTQNRYSSLAGFDEHIQEGVITVCDSTKTDEEESEVEPLKFGDVVAGLFVVYRMALFEHRVLFDVGVAVEDSAISDFDEILAAEGRSATSTGDSPVLINIAGGGDQETNNVSPPSKRRKRGKGRAKQLAKKIKSSRSYEEVQTITDVQNVPDESGENEIKNVTPTASPRLDRKAAWRQSPKGRASSAASSRKYEMSPLGRATRRRYKTSGEGIETSRRYESSQERKESKKVHESTTKSTETRRRYRSAEGRFIRAEYGLSEGGRAAKKRAMQKYGSTEHGRESIKRAKQKYGDTEHGSESTKRAMHKYGNSEHGRESIKRALQNFGNTEHGRESIKRALQNFGNTEHGRKSLTRARKKYELKEAAQKRRLRYKQRKAYNQRLRKATKHLVAKAAKTEPQRANHDSQSDDDLKDSKPGAGNSFTNKEAMATIKSHKVRHIQDYIFK